MHTQGQLTNHDDVAAFIYAGNATFTLRSERTGFTVHLSRPQEQGWTRSLRLTHDRFGQRVRL
jgi:hypothetical protein